MLLLLVYRCPRWPHDHPGKLHAQLLAPRVLVSGCNRGGKESKEHGRCERQLTAFEGRELLGVPSVENE